MERPQTALAEQSCLDVVPLTVAEADVLIELKKGDIAEIEEQLADPRRRTAAPNVRDYRNWRERAIHAKRLKERQLAELKVWRRERQAQATADEAGLDDPTDPRQLIGAAYEVLQTLDREPEFEFEPQERAVMDALKNWLVRYAERGTTPAPPTARR